MMADFEAENATKKLKQVRSSPEEREFVKKKKIQKWRDNLKMEDV